MNKITVNSEEDYFKIKEDREKRYRDECKVCPKLLKIYTNNPNKENREKFFTSLRNLDEFYLDWTERIEYKYDGI